MADNRCDSWNGLSRTVRVGSPAPRAPQNLPMTATHVDLPRRELQNSIAQHGIDPETFREFPTLPAASLLQAEHDGMPATFGPDSLEKCFPGEPFHAPSASQGAHEGNSMSFAARASSSQHGIGESGLTAMVLLTPANDGSAHTVSAGMGESSGASATSTPTVPNEPPIPLIPEHEAFGSLNLLLDGMTLEILGCTVGLMAVTGPLVFKSRFQSMVINFDDFYEWMQRSVNCFLSDCEEDIEPFDLEMTPCVTRTSCKYEICMTAMLIRAELQARASTMGVEHVAGFVDDEHEILCLFDFANVSLLLLDQ